MPTPLASTGSPDPRIAAANLAFGGGPKPLSTDGFLLWRYTTNSWVVTFPVNLPSVVPQYDHFASVGNVGTGEDTLYEDTFNPSATADGDKWRFDYGGTFASSATATRELRLYFAGSLFFDSGALTISSAASWTLSGFVMRKSSSAARYMATLTTENAALAAYTAVGEITGLTLSSFTIKLTGEAAGVGAATNDVVAMVGSISFEPAAY